ncbi:hypothetical protein CROQUDRAFT_664491 [Cronartium quercuum f. sp. fusiforme G11]|uniref:Condensin complex subunit 1 n=1 Tax=Cronartium quercuum f. sp. fusiforme G11 TaxID=708437 RepID=A0A9P6N7U8_9BASI|nr:hypothetical protein CROQUDRAFT_664491 [Cronartium quercuum f. sp. fusiforme G11]
MNFNLSSRLLSLIDQQIEIENETNFSKLSLNQIRSILDSLVDKITQSSDSITNPEIFQTFQSLLKYGTVLPKSILFSILDVLPSTFETEIISTIKDSNPTDHELYKSHKSSLEHYAFLLHWLVIICEKRRLNEKSSNINQIKKPKNVKSSKTDNDDPFDWSHLIIHLLNPMLKALSLKTEFIWNTSQDRDAFVSCFTKSVYQILEIKQFSDLSNIRLLAFKIICTAAKSHNQAYNTQTTILQSLQYFDHLSEPMAELVHLLVETRDLNQLANTILIEISKKSFTSQDNKTPKPISKFLIKLTELSPRLISKQIVILQKQLDSDSYIMRICLLEIFGKLICSLSFDEEQQVNQDNIDQDNPHHLDKDNNQSIKLDGFFNLLFDRFCDSNTFVRLKVVSIFEEILKLPVPFPKHRLRLAAEATRSLEDKSSQVRKHCISVLTKLIETHPYGLLHGGELIKSEWESRYSAVVKELSVFDLPDAGEIEAREIMETDTEGEEKITENEEETNRKNEMNSAASDQQVALGSINEEELMKLKLTKRYYSDAIIFINILESSLNQIEKLLASKIKSEVLESINFFKVAFIYKLNGAQKGITLMLHLIWSNESSSNNAIEELNEDGIPIEKNQKEFKGIKSALIDCYHELYFSSLLRLEGESLSAYASRNIDRITRNMIELTYQPTLAELTSLEELMGVMMERGHVHEDVICKLWEVYSTTKEISKQQRRGSILVLSMLAAPRPKVVSENLDKLIAIGLGPIGKNDLVLAKYSCMALTRIGGSAKKVKGSLVDRNIRLPMDNPVFIRLAEVIELETRSKEWFAMAEQALNTIYALADQPDMLASEIIKSMTLRTFETSLNEVEKAQTESMEIDEDTTSSQLNNKVRLADSFKLSQVIFIAGHTAIKQLVHLELVEREFKRRKTETDTKTKNNGKQKQTMTTVTTKEQHEGEELDQVAGNVEDEIGDLINYVKEKEMIYGQSTLLSVYGPMIVQICGLPSVYKNETLRTAATLSLTKFMCVSSEFCDQHLMLLFKILETSKNSIIRSNIIIGLGDLSINFNNLIDQHSDELYKGLNDSNLDVRKNTLMVLTHLILNGMIKVKGQLGEIAKCINDSNNRISNLAQLFFDELSKKDQNAIYNNLPDMISHLSVGKHAIEVNLFKLVMDQIFKHLKKDKQSESIVEKLCQRFRLVNEIRQWQDIAYCLSLLQFKSEKSLKKLVDGLPYYQDKLYDTEVFKSFEDILNKVKSNKWAKDHQDLMEFEKVIISFKEKGQEDLQMENKVANKKKKVKKNNKKVRQEEEQEEDDQEEDEQIRVPTSKTSKGKGKATTRIITTRKTRRRDVTPDSD